MGQLVSAVGCGENKTGVEKLSNDKTSNPDDLPSPAISLTDINNSEGDADHTTNNNDIDRNSSSDGHRNITNGENNNINNRVISSASSSGIGSKPPTPPEEGKPWGSGQPISFISGRIPSAYENIPSSDLGESLDVRRAARLFNSSTMMASKSASSGEYTLLEDGPPPNSASFLHHTSHSACSGESLDSGISDPGEEYSFVITENSPPELVKRVEEEFAPVEDLDLTITGKGCPRLLSGSQKTRMEEAAILESLRQEGFIATSKSKSAGGISFEVVDSASGKSSASSSTKPEDFLPMGTQKRLEARRAKYGPGDRTEEQLQERWSGAYERRQAELAARQEKMAEQIKGSEAEKQRLEELTRKHESKTDAALAKREEHLKSLRDKLKQQNQRAQHVKLKKLINGPPVPTPLVRTTSDYSAQHTFANTDLFFN